MGFAKGLAEKERLENKMASSHSGTESGPQAFATRDNEFGGLY